MERLRPETTFDEVGLLMVLPERRGDSFSRWCRVLCLESWDSDMVKRVAASTSEIAKGLANGLTEANAEQKDLMRRIYEETLENGVCFRITPGGLKKKLFGGDSGRLVTRREVKEKIGWSMDRFKMDVSRVKGNAGGWRETTVVSILTSSFFIKSNFRKSSYSGLSLMVLNEGCLRDGFITLEEVIESVSESTDRKVAYVGGDLVTKVLGPWSRVCLPKVLMRDKGRLVSKYVLPRQSAAVLEKALVNKIGGREDGQWDSVVGVVSAEEIEQIKRRIKEDMGLLIGRKGWESNDGEKEEKVLWGWINEAKVVADQMNEREGDDLLKLSWEDGQVVLMGLAARELIVEAYEWFVGWQAGKFARLCWKESCGSFSAFLSELKNYGRKGLLVAIDRYDDTLGLKLTTYAAFWIEKEMKSCLKGKLSGGVVVGSNLLGKVVEVNKGVAEFISKNGGGRPSQEETLSIIEELGVVPEKSMQLLRRVRDVQGMRCSISWDGCVFSDDGDGLEWAEVVSFVLSSRRPVEDVVMKGISMEELTRAMESVLTSREEHVMRRRFLGDGECERKEVARMFGVTPEIIRQIEVVAKRKLRVVL